MLLSGKRILLSSHVNRSTKANWELCDAQHTIPKIFKQPGRLFVANTDQGYQRELKNVQITSQDMNIPKRRKRH